MVVEEQPNESTQSLEEKVIKEKREELEKRESGVDLIKTHYVV